MAAFTEKEKKELKALATEMMKKGFGAARIDKVYTRTEKGNASKSKTTYVVFDWTAPKKFADAKAFKAFAAEILDAFGVKYQKAIRNPKHRSEYTQSGLWLMDYKADSGFEELVAELNKTLQPKAAKPAAVAESNPFAKYLR